MGIADYLDSLGDGPERILHRYLVQVSRSFGETLSSLSFPNCSGPGTQGPPGRDAPFSNSAGGNEENAGVKLIGNTKFPTLVDDTLRSFRVQKTLKPDIYLPMHPESYFAGKVERIKAGETPHSWLDPEGYAKLIADTETNFQKRVQEERTKTSRPAEK